MGNINLNMKIGKAKPMKEDINFFEIMRNRTKAGNNDIKSIITFGVCFALAVGLAFSGLKVGTYFINKKTSAIHAEIDAPELQAKLSEVTVKVEQNDLLIAYTGLMKKAGQDFALLNKIDAALLNTVAKATPKNVTVLNMNITEQEFIMKCECKEFMDPSLYMQQLVKTKRFTNVTFNDVSFDIEDNNYGFTVNCLF